MTILTAALAAILVLGGVVLLLDLGGAARVLTERVTSRSLGSLAPGYAADRNGLRVYAVLLIAIGAALAGLALATQSPLAGALLFAAGIAGFLVATALVLRGEIRTYRALPKNR